MSKVILSTISSVTIPDLGNVNFTHPITSLTLYDSDSSENEFELQELRNSQDLQNAIDNNQVALVDENSVTIPNILNFVNESLSSGKIVERGPNPPTDTSKLWFNNVDQLLYFYDSTNWLSEQIFETTFNDQGTTPNNTFFRVGNTVGNDLGVGYPLDFTIFVVGLSFNRTPGTASLGNYWLYSNTSTGTNNAAVVAVFTVDNSATGFLLPNIATTINEGSYVSLRWNGTQTNNNVCTLQYRKKYIA